MDVLSDILDVLRLRGTLYFRTSFSPPFAVAVPHLGQAARFHIAAQGGCHVRVAGEHDVILNSGDMILIPNGREHVLCDEIDTKPAALEDVLAQSGYSGEGVLVHGGTALPNADTKLICGHFTFADGADHPLLRALPDFLLVTAEMRASAPLLDELLRLIIRQMFAQTPGTQASVIRLSEVLFIEVIRCCAAVDTNIGSIISAMADTPIGTALGLLHHNPEKRWSLDTLARGVGMSRSRFAHRFQNVIGCAPMSYLSNLRLQRAMNLLTDTTTPVQVVASQVGYQSPAAFSRAFSDRYGCSPRQIRHA